MSLNWFLARRYLASRKRGRLLSFITFISLGGVTVGVAALVVVIGVMSGMQNDLQRKILAANAHVIILEIGESLRMSNWEPVVDSVGRLEGVTAVAPFILSSTSIRKLGVEYSQAAQLIGVLPDPELAPVTELEEKVRQGVYDLGPTESGLPPMIVGVDLAQRMSLYTGDTVVVIGLDDVEIGAFGPRVPIANYEMTGTFETGMYDTDAGSVLVRLDDAQTLLRLAPDEVSGIGVQTSDPMEAEALRQRISDAIPFPYNATSWFQTNRALFSALKLEKLAMGLILFLIVLVAAFNIVSTLVMVVADRKREIGILKSMGMTDGAVLKVFVLQGAWIGIVGTVLGMLLGLAIAVSIDQFGLIQIPPDVYFVDRLPVKIEVLDLLWIFAASVTVAFVATVYPSIQAARLQPVEAIRAD